MDSFTSRKEQNNKFHYIFSGVVHPTRVNFEANIDPINIKIQHSRFNIDGVLKEIRFKKSNFSAIYETDKDHTKRTNANLETLKNFIDQSLRMIVDIFCYINSYSYDLEIVEVICEDLKINQIFNVQGEKNVNKDKEQTNKEFQEILFLIINNPRLQFLGVAFADFRRSIKYPEMTGFFCFRSIEVIRQFYFEDISIKDNDKRRKKGWEKMREDLDLDRGFFKEIENFAILNRHGNTPPITYKERENIMNKTRKVINKFIEFTNEK